MATFTVTTARDVVADDGVRSLREAVAAANATPGADTIVFLSALEGRTLTLTHGELTLRQDITIDGDGNNDGKEITLSGGDLSRVLHATGDGSDAQLRDLTLTHGTASGDGGAVLGDQGTRLLLEGVTVRDNTASGYFVSGGGIAADTVTLTDCTVAGNSAETGSGFYASAAGGGIAGGTVTLVHSTVAGNSAEYGGGISGGTVILTGSTISGNSSNGILGNLVILADSVVSHNTGYGISDSYRIAYGNGGTVHLTNSTISDNSSGGIRSQYSTLNGDTISGNGVGITSFGGTSTISNSIVAGNGGAGVHSDVNSTLTISNGHNIFGSDVTGAIIGDLQGVAPSKLFAAIDPATGGGQLNSAGVIPLRDSLDNPALGGGDPLAALPSDQLGHARPLPGDSLPDIGAAERSQTLSTHASPNNDVLTGTDVANTILGHGGADLIRGLGGNDTLRGENGSDVLDGGSGNDLLDGGTGIDLARFGGSTAVTIDLVAGAATRGSETDTLTSIQGAIGSSAADTFRGDNGTNWFQGGAGRDVANGGAGRDVFDYDRTSDSVPGSANRDVINDFAHNSDKLDLVGIDANTTVAGNQAFTWLGDGPLTGAGQADFITSGGSTIVQASTDADATPELQIRLTGSIPLSEGDFFL